MNIGIVGCGAIARYMHIPAILTNPRVRLAGLVDKNPSATKFLCRLFDLDAPSYTSISDVHNWDAAIVAVPPHLHAPVSKELLDLGINVLCEKPIATNAADAHALLDTAKRSGRVFQVVMQKIYHPNTRLLKTIIDNGTLGKIQSIDLECVQKNQWDTGNIDRYNPERVPGGVTFENGIHWLYRLHYWFGTARLSEYADDRLGGVEANAQLDCEYQFRDRSIPCKMYFSSDHNGQQRILIEGSDSSVILDDHDDKEVTLLRFSPGEEVTMKAAASLGDINYGYHQLEMFRQLIAGQTVEDYTRYSLAALELLMNAYDLRVALPQPWLGDDAK